MSEYRIGRREAFTYCALPLTITRSERTTRIPAAFREVDSQLAGNGIGDRGYEVIRYRRSKAWENLDLEVGWILYTDVQVEEPFVVDVLPAGLYVIGRLEGPYSRLEKKTRAMMEWGTEQGVEYDIERRPDGCHWACRYEVYVTEPTFGPDGPSGTVDVCLLLRD